MAKFNMKEYENFMEEEARQDRLQEELESKRQFETLGSEYDWHDYLEKQEEERRREEFNHYPEYDGYFDKDDFEDDDCNEDGYDPDDMETAYDPYGDLLFVPDEYDGYSDEDDSDDDYFIDDLLYLDDSDLEGMSATTERISRKAVARNRHHAAERAKRKAEKSAEILKGKFWKLYSEVTSRKESNHYRSHFNERDAFIEGEYLRPNEMRRLYYSEKSASKKANISREKTA